MVYASVEDFAKSYTSATFGLTIVTLTDKKVLGMNLKKLKVVANASVGIDYYHAVRALAEKQGIKFDTEKEFLEAFPKEPTYARKTDIKAIYEHVKSGQKYLRTYEGRSITKVVKVVYFDENGNAITNATLLAQIAAKEGASSKKQNEIGMAKIVELKQPKIENALFLQQGDKVYESARFAAYKRFM